MSTSRSLRECICHFCLARRHVCRATNAAHLGTSSFVSAVAQNLGRCRAGSRQGERHQNVTGHSRHAACLAHLLPLTSPSIICHWYGVQYSTFASGRPFCIRPHGVPRAGCRQFVSFYIGDRRPVRACVGSWLWLPWCALCLLFSFLFPPSPRRLHSISMNTSKHVQGSRGSRACPSARKSTGKPRVGRGHFYRHACTLYYQGIFCRKR